MFGYMSTLSVRARCGMRTETTREGEEDMPLINRADIGVEELMEEV